MNINVYQEGARRTAIYPGKVVEYTEDGYPTTNDYFPPFIYCTLKLNGEAGEIAEFVGKAHRDGYSLVSKEAKLRLAKELGDILWYIANMATDLGFDLSEIAQLNLDKLADRKARGVIGGSGDER